MNYKKITTIEMPETVGKKVIATASDVFAWIDSDFKDWNTQKNPLTGRHAQNLDVMELTKDSTFAQIFTDPENMRLTQEQIIEFCKNHKEDLSQWCTFFLFKANNEFFVARVDVRGGGLDVDVYRFSHAYVWYAEFRRRFVIPQLTPSPLEFETLGHSDSLTLESAIKICKENNLKVYKEL